MAPCKKLKSKLKDCKFFHLNISVRFDAKTCELEEWRVAFEYASEILYDATEGQLQLGALNVTNNKGNLKNADIRLYPDPGTSNATHFGICKKSKMSLYGDETEFPGVIVHEFGHYLFGLDDEYFGANKEPGCTLETDAHACLMAYGAGHTGTISSGVFTPGQIREFCVTADHETGTHLPQNKYNKEPCWDTIEGNYKHCSITKPAAMPNPNPHAGHTQPTWNVVPSGSAAPLIFDGSKGWTASDFEALKFSLSLFVDMTSVFRAETALVRMGPEAELFFPRGMVTEKNRLPLLESILEMEPEGRGSLAAAGTVALSQLDVEKRVANQSLVIASRYSTQLGKENLDSLETGLERSFVQGRPVLFGSESQPLLNLLELAEATDGEYHAIENDNNRTLLDEIVTAAADAIDGVEIIQVEAISLAGEPVDRRVLAEVGCEQLVFIVRNEAECFTTLELFAPDGKQVDPSQIDVRKAPGDAEPYVLYSLDAPMPGQWRVRIRSTNYSEEPQSVMLWTLGRNQSLYASVHAEWDDATNELRLFARAFGEELLGGIERPAYDVYAASDYGAPSSRPIASGRLGLGVREEPGEYEATVAIEPKTVIVHVRLVNAGLAYDVSRPITSENSPPQFVRTVRRVVPVGPR